MGHGGTNFFYNLQRIRNRMQKLPGSIDLDRPGTPKPKPHCMVNDKQNPTAHPLMTPTKKPNPLLELLINIVIPSVILMKFSGEQDLGAVGGLLVALAFPLGWGTFELLGRSKLSFFAVLGLVSILLTGGIGLLQLDTQWLAVKEAAIPGLIGVAVLVSTRTRYPLVKTLLYNPTLIDVARVQQHLEARGTARDFEARLQNATYMLGGTFFFSAAMNFFLATWIVTSPAGSEAFNAELGRLTLLSYPMIALPSMLMMMGALYYLARATRELAGLKLSETLNTGDDRQQS
jgi:hypothetical protein